MNNSKVFMSHMPWKKTEGGMMRPKFALEPAAAYGQLKPIFNDSDAALVPQACKDYIKQFLEAEHFDPAIDYFLCAGELSVAMYMQEVAVLFFGKGPRLLRWDKRRNAYNVLEG
jgi:hypothetical protein